jgi:hypothetical protein
MRTTVTLEPDVASRLEHEMQRTGDGMKAVMNRALRIGLGMRPFRVVPHRFGFRPGTDLDRLNQLVDELEVEEGSKKLPR